MSDFDITKLLSQYKNKTLVQVKYLKNSFFKIINSKTPEESFQFIKNHPGERTL